MKRVVTFAGLAVLLTIPVVAVAVRGLGSRKRTHEDCTKDTIFCVQRATRCAIKATDFDSLLQLESCLREETRHLTELTDEILAMSPPSRWEQSRMRKHRSLAQTALEAWEAMAMDVKQRLDQGAVPPHVRGPILDAINEFESARNNAWTIVLPLPN